MVATLLLPVVLSLSVPGKALEAAAPYRDALAAATHHFAEEGKVEYLRALVGKHPELLEATRPQQLGKPTHGDGYTPLQTSARHGRDEVVGFLVEKGANVNAADGYGYTPLHLAAEGGHLDVVKRLVKAGAKVDARTAALPEGFAPGGPPDAAPVKFPAVPARTALQIAEDMKRTEVVTFLKSVK